MSLEQFSCYTICDFRGNENMCPYTDCRVIYNKHFFIQVYRQSTSLMIQKEFDKLHLDKYNIPVFSFIESKPYYMIAIHCSVDGERFKPSRKIVFEVHLPDTFTEKGVIDWLQSDNKEEKDIPFKVFDIRLFELSLCQGIAINCLWVDFQFAINKMKIVTNKDDRVLMISKKDDISYVIFIIESEKEGKKSRVFYDLIQYGSLSVMDNMIFGVSKEEEEENILYRYKQEAQQRNSNENIVRLSSKQCWFFPISLSTSFLAKVKAMTKGYKAIDIDEHEKKL